MIVLNSRRRNAADGFLRFKNVLQFTLFLGIQEIIVIFA